MRPPRFLPSKTASVIDERDARLKIFINVMYECWCESAALCVQQNHALRDSGPVHKLSLTHKCAARGLQVVAAWRRERGRRSSRTHPLHQRETKSSCSYMPMTTLMRKVGTRIEKPRSCQPHHTIFRQLCRGARDSGWAERARERGGGGGREQVMGIRWRLSRRGQGGVCN